MIKKAVIGIFAFFYIPGGGLNAQTLGQTYNNVTSHSTEESNNDITSYFRIVANHITSDSSGYTLNMSLIAFRDSAHWKTGKNFKTPLNTFLRHTQISGTVNLDKSQNITNIGLKPTFAVWDKRDTALYWLSQFNQMAGNNNLSSQKFEHIEDTISLITQRRYADTLKKQKGLSDDAALIAVSDSLQKWNNTNGKLDSSKINKTFINILNIYSKKIYGTNYFELSKNISDLDNLAAKMVQQKGIVTVYPSATYNYANKKMEDYSFGFTYLVGLSRNPKKKPWQFQVQGSIDDKDTTSAKSVNNFVPSLSGSMGINKVLAENSQKQSIMELDFSGQLKHYLMNNAKQPTPTIDATFKIQAFKNTWLPLTLSYDPGKGNLLGYINIAININNSSSSTGGTKKSGK